MSGVIWSKFFWPHWEGEPSLRLCSFAAQGLWMRMLCIAARHDPIGYVAVAGQPLELPGLIRLTGGTESEVATLLGELERNGVFSRDRKGRIYSRRMVRDARKAATARTNGAKNAPKRDGPSPGKDGGNPASVHPHKPEAKSHEPKKKAAADARASEPLLSEPAWKLASQLAVIAGHPAEPADWPSGWCGAPMRIQGWLNEGWPEAAILAGARFAVTKRPPGSSAINSVVFFEGAIVDEIARQRKPLPTIPKPSEVSHAQTVQRHPGGAYGASKDRFRAAHAELKASIADAERASDEGGEDGGSAVRPAAAA